MDSNSYENSSQNRKEFNSFNFNSASFLGSSHEARMIQSCMQSHNNKKMCSKTIKNHVFVFQKSRAIKLINKISCRQIAKSFKNVENLKLWNFQNTWRMFKLHAIFNEKLVKLQYEQNFLTNPFFNFQLLDTNNVAATVLPTLEVSPLKLTDTILTIARQRMLLWRDAGLRWPNTQGTSSSLVSVQHVLWLHSHQLQQWKGSHYHTERCQVPGH